MRRTGVFARLCTYIVVAQLLAIASIYFFRLEGDLLESPPIANFLETQRVRIDTQRFWSAWYDNQRVWGYVDRHSVKRGEKFNVMLSHRPDQADFKGRVEIYRIGAYPGGKDRQKAWSSNLEIIRAQETTETAASSGAGWVPSVRVETDDWSSGYYAIDVVGEDGKRDPNVAYIVAVDAAAQGDVLVKLSTNTYQAYAKFGGHSLYEGTMFGEQGSLVSFDRPAYAAFFDYEYYYVIWLEALAQKEKLHVAYITDFDLHSNPSWPNNYKLFIALGHDEYWSKEEFDAIENRLFSQGKNMLILSGNTGYWQVRYGDLDRPPGDIDRGRQMVCTKVEDDPIALRASDPKLLLTTKFRDLARRPETMLLGAGFDSWFPPGDPKLRYDYRVVDAASPLFEGTGWKSGDSIGNHVVGYEWDNRDPDRDGQRLWKANASANAALASERIKVLFEAEPLDVDGKKGKAEAVYFETPAGARVFNASSIRWAWGVGKSDELSAAFQTFNRNLVMQFVNGGPAQAPQGGKSAAPPAKPERANTPSQRARGREGR